MISHLRAKSNLKLQKRKRRIKLYKNQRKTLMLDLINAELAVWTGNYPKLPRPKTPKLRT